jgi:pilus assembly protein CpaC
MTNRNTTSATGGRATAATDKTHTTAAATTSPPTAARAAAKPTTATGTKSKAKKAVAAAALLAAGLMAAPHVWAGSPVPAESTAGDAAAPMIAVGTTRPAAADNDVAPATDGSSYVVAVAGDAPATRPATQPAAPGTQPVAEANPEDVAAPDVSVAPDAPAASVLAVPVIAAAPATRPADPVGIIENVPEDGRVHLLVGRSFVVKTRTPYKRVSLTQPDVAGDNEVDPTSILLTAKKPGAAQLIVWDDKDKTQVLDVVVEVDMVALAEMVKKSFPTADATISNANGSIVVRGRVPNVQVGEQITELLSAYGKVLNFLEMAGGQQVMLQVRFAEVSRSATTALGVNFGFGGTNGVEFGNNVPGGGPFAVNEGIGNLTRVAGANVTLFGGGRIGSTNFDIFLSALRNNNLLRVLAEPNLATLSGKEAQFLAGGEFPIPVPQSGGSGNAAITVEYKQFGIRLSFVPVVLGDGKIRVQGTAEVSDLDFSRSVALGGFSIPSLTKRTISTTIELSEGQTFALAGLLNNRVTTSKQAVPLLGDIPVLGALFRSVRYERSETELVVLVTPRLVEGMNPRQVPELPGERWVYPSEADLFLRQYMGGPGSTPTANKPAPVQFRGPYGFVPAGGGLAARKGPEAGSRVTSVGDGRDE